MIVVAVEKGTGIVGIEARKYREGEQPIIDSNSNTITYSNSNTITYSSISSPLLRSTINPTPKAEEEESTPTPTPTPFIFNGSGDQTTAQGPWKTHVDNELGIKVQYPPNWEVTVKTNGFDTGPDLTIGEVSGFNSFGITTVDDVGGLDTELAATVGQNEITGEGDTRLVESVKERPPIGGEEAYSFTYTTGSELSFLQAVQEPITVIHDGTGYIFAFTGMTSSFDDPENVEIRERMLNSIRFLDSAGSGVSGEEVDNEEAEDEDNDDNEEESTSKLFE